ncbi:MAG: CoA transferase [Deltaproteobacteria bacterium]|nr:CoA transferase [Deltaproteobacteria bacterium]
MSGPLEGFRIVDLTAYITGPLATMILADQGAEVIKVEPIGLGDVWRHVGTARGGMSAMFALCNRSKRSIALNLKDPRGRELLQRLVGRADVMVQNFRPGVVERLGIDEARMREIKPDLIYVSITAFGYEGPYSQRPAFDPIVQALSGTASVQADGETGEPRMVQQALCDKVAATTTAQSITAALLARERGAGGQHLRVAMLDAAIAFLWLDGMANYTILGDDVHVHPPASASIRTFATGDGHIAMAPITDAQAHGMFRALGREELIEDPRFAHVEARSSNIEELIAECGGDLQKLTTDQAVERLAAEQVPCAPVVPLEELHEHPQVVANGTLTETEHPKMGRMRQPRPPVRFTETPAEIRYPAPALGQHTDEVLREAGVAALEIEELRGKGVVG